MTKGTFEEAYKKLNPRQKEAVDTIEGPVMVIAGPGTGKTQILTLRIANILERTDLPPSAILALTFTEAATGNMRRRLVELTGDHRAYYVNIATFHGFANQLIQEYPEYFPSIIGARNAAEVDQIQIVRNILLNGSEGNAAFERLKPMGDMFFHVPDILTAIRSAKSEGYSPSEFSSLLDSKEKELNSIPDLKHEKGRYAGKMKGKYEKEFAILERNRELARIYEAYESELRKARLYDFEDMLLAVIATFETRPEFLLQVQERFQYLLVDEHQDTNGAQNKLLELIAGYFENPNLFVVGDEKQAIFRFQGASLENFLYFQKKYPEATMIYLKDNYRSYQPILDSAASIIKNNATVLKHDLQANRGEGSKDPIRVFSFSNPEAEEFSVGQIILEKTRQGIPPEEIAVLYRQNRDAGPLSDMLSRLGISHVIASDRNVLEDRDIHNLLLLIEAIADFGNDALLAEVLHLEFLNLEPLEIYKLIAERKRDESLYGRLAPLPLGKKLSKWKKDSVNKNFLEFFEILIKESGFLENLLKKPTALEKVSALTSLWNEIRNTVGERGDYRLSDFVRHIEIIRTHHLPIRMSTPSTKNAVQLMTAHKSKGLEFQVVIITGATDGHWGNRRDPNRLKLPFKTSVDVAVNEKNEDERRLFYMALTRARDEAYITYSRERSDGKETVPSQFLGEIKENLKLEQSGEKHESKLEKERLQLFQVPQIEPAKEREKDFLRELFLKRGLSATALNNYLSCPWRYFYVNLLRLPSVPSLNQAYGTAVHAALENFFSAKRRGEQVGKNFLVDSYLRDLHRQPLAENDMERLTKKGSEALTAYHDHYKESWNYKVITELRVKIPISIEGQETIILSGVLDKLELAEDSANVGVVDYKTRAPRSRNWIEGNTADSNGDYKRQLIFYKLLLDSSPELGYQMKTGAIDFVEPNPSGIFKKEAFEIEEKEVKELRHETDRVISEIFNLEFWDKTCDQKDCEWCRLRESTL